MNQFRFIPVISILPTFDLLLLLFDGKSIVVDTLHKDNFSCGSVPGCLILV